MALCHSAHYLCTMIETICVCGAGTMGSGIAQTAAQHGFYAIQYDLNQDMLAKSKAAIQANLQFLVSKGKLSEEDRQKTLNRIRFVHDHNDCIADVIIEAIVEKPEAKINLFNLLAELNHSETIFATNTSSLSVTAIQQKVHRPERVAGMHFFNPAHIMKLVEIVTGGLTAKPVADTLFQLALDMGKTPVHCTDAPGFIVNHVARPYYLEAMHLVEQGAATFETVDAIMEATGFKMGPFRLMDLIGMDINYSVSNIVWEALGKPGRLQPAAMQKAKLDAGNLGKKTGAGFYTYNK